MKEFYLYQKKLNNNKNYNQLYIESWQIEFWRKNYDIFTLTYHLMFALFSGDKSFIWQFLKENKLD